MVEHVLLSHKITMKNDSAKYNKSDVLYTTTVLVIYPMPLLINIHKLNILTECLTALLHTITVVQLNLLSSWYGLVSSVQCTASSGV